MPTMIRLSSTGRSVAPSDARPGPSATTQKPFLMERHWQQVQRADERLRQVDHWHGDLPVLLLERCWLRLTCVGVAELAQRLPPDCTPEAPELRRYRELVDAGHGGWEAQRICWDDFGSDACQQALRQFWAAQERGHQGWTLQAYLQFLKDYRSQFSPGCPRSLPLMVLARSRQEHHQLHWLQPDGTCSRRSMRDTCP